MGKEKTGTNVHREIDDGLLLGPVNQIIDRSPQNIALISAAVLAGYLTIIGGLMYVTKDAQALQEQPRNNTSTESVEK